MTKDEVNWTINYTFVFYLRISYYKIIFQLKNSLLQMYLQIIFMNPAIMWVIKS